MLRLAVASEPTKLVSARQLAVAVGRSETKRVKKTAGIGLKDVNAVYAGPEGDLWELLMGQQIHVGGFKATLDLAERAGIGPGLHGVDLCCCNGAGMRLLVRFRQVASMTGVDATAAVVERGRARCQAEGLAERVRLIVADVCDSGLPNASADFVWGEDAWCYVTDKERLIQEAARIVKPGGTIAFTDWVEGPAGLSEAEAERLLRFMKFPNVQDTAGYAALLADSGCEVLTAEDTGRFPAYMDLYINMVDMQLTYDALRLLSFDADRLGALAREMVFLRELAHAAKVTQARFIARRGNG
jgi:ubiquinone/menaquinone biosynthesis C-methylase UbiE